MAFGNISTFYLPTAANAGASQWGSDVRKLLAAADAGNDASSKTNHGTGGAVVRTVDPYTTTTTDDAQANFGWAIAPSDMGSVAGAKRFFPAGNHTITLSTASSAAVLAADASFTLYVYRVGPAPGRTRTLIASATGASFNYGAVVNTYRTETVAVNCPEIVLAVDETIQYSIEQSSAGTTLTGRTNTHDTGTQGGVAIRVDTPGLKVLADGDYASSGVASGTVDSSKVLAAVAQASGVASSSVIGAATASADFSAAGSATGNVAASSVAATVFTAQGSAQGNAQGSRVLGTVFTCDVGGGGTVVEGLAHPVVGSCIVRAAA